LLCGLAQSLGMLIFFRIMQGLGGGGMAPSEQSILADTFPPQKRAQAFALYAVAVIVAPTVGPTLGGWITDNYTWNWIFFINVPVGLMSLGLVQWLVVEPDALKKEREEQLKGGLNADWIGILLIAVALGCLEIVLDKGQREDWFQSGFIVSLSLISAAAFAIFFPWELSRRDPVVDVRLLFTRQFGMSFLMMLAVGAVLFSTIQLLPQLLQENYGYTAMLSGLVLMPGGFAMLLMTPISGLVSSWVQPKYLMALAMGVVVLAMWHSTSLSPDASFSFFAWARLFQVVSLPFLFIPITAAAYAGLPAEKTNQASALINVARNLGGSIGVSLSGALLAQRAQFHQSRLVEHVFPSSSAYQTTIDNAVRHFTSEGFSNQDAHLRAVAQVGQLIQSQSSLLAYMDVFYALAVFGLLMLPLAFLLKHVDIGSAPAH
jgi:DHA2 family multidrug resistance protein